MSQSGVEFSFLCVREIVLCEYSDGEKEIKNNVLSFRKTKYQLDGRVPSSKIVPRARAVMTVVYPINVVVGKVDTHLFV